MSTKQKDEMDPTSSKASNYINSYINYLPEDFQEKAVSIFRKNNIKVVKLGKAQKQENPPISVNVILKQQLPSLPSPINAGKKIDKPILKKPIENKAQLSVPPVSRIRVRKSEELLEKPPDVKKPLITPKTRPTITKPLPIITKLKKGVEQKVIGKNVSKNITIIRGDFSDIHNEQQKNVNNCESYPISIIKVEREGIEDHTPNFEDNTLFTNVHLPTRTEQIPSSLIYKNVEIENDQSPAVLQSLSKIEKPSRQRQSSTIEKLRQNLKEKTSLLQTFQTKIKSRNKRILELKYKIKELQCKYINLKQQAREVQRSNFYKSHNSQQVVDIVCKLYGISPQAYELVRKYIDKTLPTPRYIKQKLLQRQKSLVSNTCVENNIILNGKDPATNLKDNNTTDYLSSPSIKLE